MKYNNVYLNQGESFYGYFPLKQYSIKKNRLMKKSKNKMLEGKLEEIFITEKLPNGVAWDYRIEELERKLWTKIRNIIYKVKTKYPNKKLTVIRRILEPKKKTTSFFVRREKCEFYVLGISKIAIIIGDKL